MTSKTRESIQEASVFPLPKLSLLLIESPAYSPYELPPDGSEELEGVTPDPSDPPVHPEPPEPQRPGAPSERARSPTPLVMDVPLVMVHDVILALLRNKAAIESTVESICVAHELNPLITESVMQVVRENLPPVGEWQRYAKIRVLFTQSDDWSHPFQFEVTWTQSNPVPPARRQTLHLQAPLHFSPPLP